MTPPSSQVPYIGSTISLLSKAGIRYEGYLHSIDQSEASVTLDHVRVFGTEDRQCERRVPSSNETFEYIIFRASDITELRVIDTPLSRPVPDPAIIRVQSKASSAAADAAAAADKSGSGGGAAGSVRRRQPRGPSSSTARGKQQRYQQQSSQHQQQNQPQILLHSHQQPIIIHHQQQQQQQQQQQSSPQRPMQQQSQRLYRNDWYGSGYRNGGGGGYYSNQYMRPPLHHYQGGEYGSGSAAGHGGFFAAPPGGVFVGSGGGNGGRPVMHFRRYHGSNVGGGGGGGGQRRASSNTRPGVAGRIGGGSRPSRRQPHQQSDGIAQAAAGAPTGKYFSADYDFETANAEMAKLLMAAASAAGVADGTETGVAKSSAVAAPSASHDVVKLAAATATDAPPLPMRPHSGYDKERSFYDDISRVDTEERTEAGGDSARPSGPSGGGNRKEAARQNALNRETFGQTVGVGGGGRRGFGGRYHGNQHRGLQRRSPV